MATPPFGLMGSSAETTTCWPGSATADAAIWPKLWPLTLAAPAWASSAPTSSFETRP